MLCDLSSASSPLCAGFTRTQGRQASPGPVDVRYTGHPLQSTQAVFSHSSCLYLSLPAASPPVSCGKQAPGQSFLGSSASGTQQTDIRTAPGRLRHEHEGD